MLGPNYMSFSKNYWDRTTETTIILVNMSRLPIRKVKLNFDISRTQAIGIRTSINKAATIQMLGRTPEAWKMALYHDDVV